MVQCAQQETHSQEAALSLLRTHRTSYLPQANVHRVLCTAQAHGKVADAVVERLLGAAITDAAVSVRRQVLRALERNSALDPLLAQADWCAA